MSISNQDKKIFLVLLILTLSLTWHVSVANQYDSNLFDQKPFPQIIIEEGEVYSIQLDQYVRGNLLEYQLFVSDSQPYLSGLVRLGDQFKIKWKDDYGLESPELLHLESFDYATHIVESGEKQLMLFFISRNFILYQYDITNFQYTKIKRINKVQLDTKMVNSQCSNLKQVNPFAEGQKILILHCSFVMKGGKKIDRLITVDLEGDDQNITNIRYWDILSPLHYSLSDFEVFNYVLNDSKSDSLFKNQLYLLTPNPNKTDLHIVNLTFNQEQKQVQIDYFDTLGFKMRFEKTMQIDLSEFKLSDYTIIDAPCGTVAILDGNFGVYFHQYLPPLSDFFIKCAHKDMFLSFIKRSKIDALYFNTNDKNSIYGSIAYPPQVTEIDISNLWNPYLKKSFKLVEDENQYVALPYMASNNDYLVQSLLDMKTQDYLIRFYKRNASQDYFAQYEFKVQGHYYPKFFYFPSYTLNQLFYRDEKFLNLSCINSPQLIIDYTRSYLQDQVSYWLNGHLQITNNAGLMKKQNFHMIFFRRGEIYSAIKNSIDSQGEPYYSCGDPDFRYDLDELISGPDYVWIQNDFQTNKTSYFTTQNRGPRNLSITELNITKCDFSVLDTLLLQKDEIYQFLICASAKSGIIKLCKITQSITEDITTFNDCIQALQIPSATILRMYYDEVDKLLMVVANSTSPLNNKESGLFFEMHFFEVGENLYWKKFEMRGNNEAFGLDISHYNSRIHKGVLIDNINDTAVATIFEINKQAFDTEILTSSQLEINQTKNITILQAILSDYNYLWLLFNNNTIITYEFVLCSFGNLHLKKVQQAYFNFEDQGNFPHISLEESSEFKDIGIRIIAIQLVDGSSSLVIFVNNSQMYSFSISTFYSLNYKMVLPKYSHMNETKYTQYVDIDFPASNSRAVRVSKGPYLLILVESQVTQKRIIYAYNTQKTMHDAFIFQIECNICQGSKFDAIIQLQTFSNDYGVLSIFNQNKIEIIFIQFHTFLIVNQDQQLELIDECKNFKFLGLLSQIVMQVISQIETDDPHYLPIFLNQKLNVSTVNSGLAIYPLQNQLNYTVQIKSDDDSDQKIILHQGFSGRNLKFVVQCNIGSIKCNSIVKDDSQTELENNLIEFVTSNRQVVKSFVVGNLIIMFDTHDRTNILKKITIDSNKTGSNQYESNGLNFITHFSQIQSFGCQVSNYVEKFNVTVSEIGLSNADEKWLFLFQCYEPGSPSLIIKLSLVSYVKNYYEDINPYVNVKFNTDYTTEIKVGRDFLQIIKVEQQPFRRSLKIIDSLLMVDSATLNVTSSKFNLFLTLDNPKSFSNQLEIHQLTIFNGYFAKGEQNSFQPIAELQQLTVITAKHLGLPTFKIKNIELSQEKKLIFCTLDWFGVIIMDTSFFNFKYLIDFTNFKKDEVLFYDSTLLMYGLIQESDNVWHFVYNRGIVEITINSTDIVQNIIYVQELTHLVPYIDYNKTFIEAETHYEVTEINHNNLGYAILIQKNLDYVFETYVGFISFMQSKNSKFLSEVLLISNQKCNSLQFSPYQFKERGVQSYLNATVICGTNFISVNFNLYPHIHIDFSNINQLIEQVPPSEQIQDQLGYKEINLSIYAFNRISDQKIKGLIKLDTSQSGQDQLFNILITLAMAITVLIFVLINNKIASKYSKEHEEDQSYQKKLEDRRNSGCSTVQFDTKRVTQEFSNNRSSNPLRATSNFGSEFNSEIDTIVPVVESKRRRIRSQY